MSGRPTEFVITCQGRDGSHLLLYALGIHPDIQNYAEVESALKGTIYERYLDPEPKQ